MMLDWELSQKSSMEIRRIRHGGASRRRGVSPKSCVCGGASRARASQHRMEPPTPGQRHPSNCHWARDTLGTHDCDLLPRIGATVIVIFRVCFYDNLQVNNLRKGRVLTQERYWVENQRLQDVPERDPGEE